MSRAESHKQEDNECPGIPQLPLIKDAFYVYVSDVRSKEKNDILDYCSHKDILGKNIGDDIRSGSLTLPLIHLLNYGDKKDKDLIKNMIYDKKNFYENFLLVFFFHVF